MSFLTVSRLAPKLLNSKVRGPETATMLLLSAEGVDVTDVTAS